MSTDLRFHRALPALVFTTLTAHAAIAQTITAIPSFGTDPNSGNNSAVTSLSANGSVAAGYATSPNGIRAFRWTPAGGAVDLGPFAGYAASESVAISDDGSVIAGNGFTPQTFYFGRPFRWTSGGGAQSIGATTDGFARGMSVNGNVIGGAIQVTGLMNLSRWTPGDGLQVLGLLAGPNTINTVGYAVSGDGTTIVGVAQQVNPVVQHAVRWRQSDGIVSLGWLPGDSEANATAISHDGSVIAGYSTVFGSFMPRRLVRWVNGNIQDLGVYLENQDTIPSAISADGVVIGGDVALVPNTDDAWLWSPTLGFESLHAYLAGQGLNLSGWSGFDRINDISSDGTALAGIGIFNGQVRGFVVRGLAPVCGPRILGGPQNTIGCVGGSLALFVTAVNPGELQPVYQWQKQGGDGEWNDLPNFTSPWGTTFSGTNTASMLITNASPVDVPGNYRCRVTAGCGSRTSGVAGVTLSTGIPEFITQPQNTNVCPDGTAVFSTGSWPPGGGPYTFQWQRETVPNSGQYVDLLDGETTTWHIDDGIIRGIVSGATTPTMQIAADLVNDRTLGPPHNRKYRCVVTNGCASVLSAPAGLKVWSCVVADLNNDFVVTVGDISPFVLLLTDPTAFEAQYPDSNPANGDTNGDDVVSPGDIAAFVAILVGG